MAGDFMKNDQIVGKLCRLITLFSKTNFSDRDTVWSGLKIDPEGGHVYIPQGSTLGDTLIGMTDTYERGGDDAIFIQQVVKFFKEVTDEVRRANA